MAILHSDAPRTLTTRVALCLYGKIGTWDQSASDARDGPASNTSVVRIASLAHRTIQRHIVHANRRDGLIVDVFLHSWNPDAGAALDALYAPNASLHQAPITRLERVRSGHLSLERVLLLRRAHEIVDDAPQLVMLSRYDIVWWADLLLRELSPSRLWLPHYCQPVIALSAAASTALESLCASDRGALVEPVYARRFFGKKLERDKDYTSMVLDHWFVASAEVAETFGAIFHRHAEYAAAMQARLAGWRPFAAHFFWVHHIGLLLQRSAEELAAGRQKQQLRVGFTSQSELDFNLARYHKFGADCAIDTAPARAPLEAQIKLMTEKLTPSPFGENTSWLAAQCPAALRSGRRAQCPWYSRRCPADLQRRVKHVLATARADAM